MDSPYAQSSVKTRPTLYLKSNVLVTNYSTADGSSSKPYEISL